MLQRIFKPKWQHKNPAVRTEAIQSLQDETILLQLLESESDAAVMAAAIDRLQSAGALLPLLQRPSAAELARQRIMTLLLSDQYDAALADCINDQCSPAQLQQLANQAPAAVIREQAVTLLTDEPLLATICAGDSHAAVRLAAAGRLQNDALIRQTLKALGKRDKRATHLLKNTLEAQAATNAYAATLTALTEQLNLLGNSPHWQRDKTRLAQLHTEWTGCHEQAVESQIAAVEQAFSAAQERLRHREQQASQHGPTIAAKQQLTEQLETQLLALQQRPRLSATEATSLDAELDTLRQQWQALPVVEEREEAQLSNRFHGILSDIRRQQKTLQANSRQSQHLEALITRADKLLQGKSLKPAPVDALLAEWDSQTLPQDPQLAEEYRSQFAQRRRQLTDRLLQLQQQRQQAQTSLATLLDALEHQLNQDNLGDCESLLQRATEQLRQLDPSAPQRTQLQNRLQQLQPRIRELSGWRHWGTDRAREALIDDAQALLANDEITVEARASAVKQLRQQWKSLGKIDPQSQQALWQRFDQACNAAYEPCKAHFDAVGEQRNAHLKARESICEQLEALLETTDWSAPDWTALDSAQQSLRQQWNNAGAVSRRHWNTIRQRFQTLQRQLDSKLDQERQRELQRREHALSELAALIESGDITAATHSARDIQQHWNPTVRARRNVEQSLWTRLRQLSDDAFGQLRDNQAVMDAEQAQHAATADALCQALQEKMAQTQLQQADLDRFIQDWQALPPLPQRQRAGLQKRYQQLLETGRKHLSKRAMTQAVHYMDSLFAEHCKLAAIELNPGQAEALNDFAQELESSAHVQRLSLVFATRLQALRNGTHIQAGRKQHEEQQRCLLDMEILLSIPSPADLEEARMARQVERLSAVISAGNRKKPEALVIEHFERYCQFAASQDYSGQQRLATILERLKNAVL